MAPSSSRLRPAYPVDQARGGKAFGQRDAHNPAAPRFDNVTTHDVVGGPVCAFDEHVRLNGRDHCLGRLLIKHRDGIDASQRSNELRPLALRRNGPRRPFVGAYRSVGIDRHNQGIAKRPCIGEIPHMTRMKEIEHTIGENHFAPGRANVRRKPRDLL
jgi:hypothetical protein